MAGRSVVFCFIEVLCDRTQSLTDLDIFKFAKISFREDPINKFSATMLFSIVDIVKTAH